MRAWSRQVAFQQHGQAHGSNSGTHHQCPRLGKTQSRRRSSCAACSHQRRRNERRRRRRGIHCKHRRGRAVAAAVVDHNRCLLWRRHALLPSTCSQKPSLDDAQRRRGCFPDFLDCIAPLPRSAGRARQDFWFCFFGAEQAVRHSGSSRTFSSCCHPRGVAQGRSLDERMHASAGGVHRTE